jgi:hypothetical protein
VEQCKGLRVDELLTLVWPAIDFERLCMKVKEGVVNGVARPWKIGAGRKAWPLGRFC